MVKVKLNNTGDDWIVLEKYSKDPESFYIDGEAFTSLQRIRKVMARRNLDFHVAITGYPGLGKSKFVSQIATICDPTFNEDRMHQTVEDFIKGVEEETEPLKSHVLDEAFFGLSSMQVRKEIGRLFLNLLNIIRQKRLYIFIVLPDFFDLSKHIAVFRTRWLFHCYGEDFGDVGNFAAFGQNSKKFLYIKGKKDENYNAHPYDIHGKFTNTSPPTFNWERYENVIKKRSLKQTTEKIEEIPNSIYQRNKLMMILKKEYHWSTKKLSEYLSMHRTYIQKIISNDKKKDREKEANTDPSS